MYSSKRVRVLRKRTNKHMFSMQLLSKPSVWLLKCTLPSEESSTQWSVPSFHFETRTWTIRSKPSRKNWAIPNTQFWNKSSRPTRKLWQGNWWITTLSWSSQLRGRAKGELTRDKMLKLPLCKKSRELLTTRKSSSRLKNRIKSINSNHRLSALKITSHKRSLMLSSHQWTKCLTPHTWSRQSKSSFNSAKCFSLVKTPSSALRISRES